MNKLSTDLFYLALEPKRIAGEKSPAVILLHGRGADENDLLGLSQYLDERLAVFSVRAPYPFEFGGYTYFQLNNDGTAEPVMFMESYKRLMKFVDGVASLPEIDSSKIFLLGFSMGTIMSYAMSLTHPEKFAGVIAQSGFVRDHKELDFKWRALNDCAFIITHGINDPIIPVEAARKTKAMFLESNAKFEYKEYPMGHEISGESLADVCAWLQKTLG
ncbi:MAG: prolyl oligopeptidase family serine peptidase [Bacteroidota bacterium]